MVPPSPKFCIRGFNQSRSCSAVLFTGKNPHVSGPAQFKPHVFHKSTVHTEFFVIALCFSSKLCGSTFIIIKLELELPPEDILIMNSLSRGKIILESMKE